MSSCIEVNQSFECLLADETELRLLVGTHATVLKAAPDSFREIAASLDETSLFLLDQILPLPLKSCFVVRFGSQGSVSGKYIGSSSP